MNLATILDAIPVVQSTGDRTLKFPTPLQDQRVYNKGTRYVERFDSGTWIAESFVGGGPAQSLGWFNVKDPAYGARGDGTTDDTAAIMLTINTAPAGSVVYAPYTTLCYIVSNLTLTKSLTFLGQSWGMSGVSQGFSGGTQLDAATTPRSNGTRFRAKTGATGYLITVGPPSGGQTGANAAYQGGLEGVRIEGVYLDGAGRAGDIGGLSLTGGLNQGQFVNLKIEHFQREAIKCVFAFECFFERVYTRYCGNTTDGGGTGIAYPCLNLNNDTITSDQNNILSFSHCSFIYPMGDAVLLDTLAGNAGATRDIDFHNCDWHGPVAAASGFPYTFSTLQQQLTILQVKSCLNVNVTQCNALVCGTAPANFVHLSTGGLGAPNRVKLIGFDATGRYSGAGTPRRGIWVETGNLQIDDCFIDGGDTANVRCEAAGLVYFGLMNTLPAGADIVTVASQTVPVQSTWQGQQSVIYGAADATFQVGQTVSPRTFNLVVTTGASGQIPTFLPGFYIYDVQAGARRIWIDSQGKFVTDFARLEKSIALVSGTVPALDASAGNDFTLAVLTNIAVVIAVPSNPPVAGYSQDIKVTIRNGSGGALTTAPTFNTAANGFKFAGGSIVNPANGTEVTYHWRWDPVQSFWYLVAVSTAL